MILIEPPLSHAPKEAGAPDAVDLHAVRAVVADFARVGVEVGVLGPHLRGLDNFTLRELH